ncbi:probable transmembrane GTPase FZO-like, chloroplastic [Glycine soja]|uniref:Putative transmembrane GTPase FZO-like, chloroplastic n=1 Tax=Glycine soja TaxID=3848 RepID=A0A445LP21_GLYSO|nr:probable transmembrane GTPase FZO-like, chloroplastic [Glycine soja]RZC25049.1 putative transmembrane GTPase FZO-like, chloroplastic [Glycine soja]
MVPCSVTSPSSPFTAIIPRHTFFSRSSSLPLRRARAFPINSLSNGSSSQFNQQLFRPRDPPQPRTLFPGGYKRPELKVPTLVLQLDPAEVLSADTDALALIDRAVSKWVGIVVLASNEASGGKLYEAACSLKSLIQDRAYLLVAERVDIAAATAASGVLLSDQGLPTVVARNTMLDSKSELVVLPLVARIVQTVDAAVNASKSEGADFLIYGGGDLNRVGQEVGSLYESVKIPIFVSCVKNNMSYADASGLLASGASGFVTSLANFGLFGDEFLHKLFGTVYASDDGGRMSENKLNVDNGFQSETEVVAGFVKLEDREKLLIETERLVLNEAIEVIKRAAPLMEEVSLLNDAVSQIDEPFLLVIVGEFNSGKSTVINALLGERYLKEGVVPTTNEITFLRYTDLDIEQQQCERHPDGQYICYIPAPILKEMTIVDTPGTNVILQRQQRLTEEFVPRADLLLFVISADRPLTGSEIAFLRYSQQWKKKAVFVLNKADIYQNNHELEEAMSFIKDNIQRLLNTEDVILYPVSARSALEAKLMATTNVGRLNEELSTSDSHYGATSFFELENFLYSFLDGSTIPGMDRMRLKLETPVAIADRLISACETLVTQDYRYAKQDLAAVEDIVNNVNDFALNMVTESLSWRRQTLSLIETTKSRVIELVEANLQLSNFDIIASYAFKGEKNVMPTTSRIQNDIIGPAVSAVQKILEEYGNWLYSKYTQQGRLYKESFEKRWPSLSHESSQINFETDQLLKKVDQAGSQVIDNFSSNAVSKSFEQEVREMILGTFGQLGVAGLSASLLTSVLQTTLDDLLALGICSAGGYLAISTFPARRQKVIDKVKRKADTLAYELEEAMKKDLTEAIENLDTFVKVLSKPYQDEAQNRLNRLVEIQEELSNVEKKLRTLQIDIQNLNVS